MRLLTMALNRNLLLKKCRFVILIVCFSEATFHFSTTAQASEIPSPANASSSATTSTPASRTTSTPTSRTTNATTIHEADRNHKPFSFRLITTSYEYKESIGIKIRGQLSGVSGDYTHPLQTEDTYLNIHAEFLKGEPVYKGYVYNHETEKLTPTTANAKDYNYTLNTNWLKRMPLPNNNTLDYSIGLAYRYLNNRINHVNAYEREQSYIYIPVRIGTEHQLSSHSSLIGTAEFDLLLMGRNKSHLSDVSATAPDLEFNQSSGNGIKLSGGVTYKLRDSTIVTAELVYRIWSIDDSEVRTFYDPDTEKNITAYEPDNTTTMAGLVLGVSF